jgi:hypothetical protein
MKKSILIFLILLAVSHASISRLYIGETNGQMMAGVDTRINFGPFFVGGDVRTVISRAVVNEEGKVIGFMPERTDYKTSFGISIGNFEVEYAHTCYHRVISSTDLSIYADTINPGDTDTRTFRFFF